MATLPTRYLTVLCDALERQGVPTAEWRTWGAATPRAGEEGELDVAQLERFLEIGRERSGRVDLGFELGRQLKLNDHDLLGYGLLSCSTLDDLLRMASRCYPAITGIFALQYRREPDHGEAIYAPVVSLPPMTQAFFLEAVARLAPHPGACLARCKCCVRDTRRNGSPTARRAVSALRTRAYRLRSVAAPNGARPDVRCVVAAPARHGIAHRSLPG